MNIQEAAGLDLQQVSREGATILDLAGDIDARCAPLLRQSLVEVIESVGGVIVVDLSDVSYLDSVGLGTLVGALKRANERGAALRFVVTGSQILKVLNITGLIRVFETYATAEEAIRGRG
jgi:anti-sigma B factor antagonist